MFHPVVFIMAFPGEIMESRLIIHHTKYFIFMLLNSMAAARMQFIWAMVCIPNHSYVSWKSEPKDLDAHILLLDNKKGCCSDYYSRCHFATWSSGCRIGLHHRCDSEEWHHGYRCSTMEAPPHHCLRAEQLVGPSPLVLESLKNTGWRSNYFLFSRIKNVRIPIFALIQHRFLGGFFLFYVLWSTMF